MQIQEVRKKMKIKTEKPMKPTPIEIEVFQPHAKKTNDTHHISVSKSCITLGVEVLKLLAVRDEDYLMVGAIGSALYFAKRPPGLSGYRLQKLGKTSKRLSIYCADVQRAFTGKYELGERVEKTAVTSEGKNATIIWFKAVKVGD
jgi:hypothetical protein